MTTFSPDQLERLNPVVQHEIEHLHQLHICVQSNTNPPCIDDMETYSTCMDAGEWNASCHLKLTLEKENAECLPCCLPPLMVRLAPDYVTSGHLNWYYSPKSAFQPTAVTPRSGSAFTARECREFLDLCYSELDRSLQQHLRRITHYRLNLRLVAKSWLDAICTAMSQFVKLDLNALLAA
ncbi:unnamed protein product [Dicrocoelium dendriticum]|nr:unnamed protein product [Dicrocoelium dendriticum]